MGSYLADAAKQVFSPTKSNAPPNWSGTGSGFSGKVSHHDTQKLRDLYTLLRQARVGIQGEVKPHPGEREPFALSLLPCTGQSQDTSLQTIGVHQRGHSAFIASLQPLA